MPGGIKERGAVKWSEILQSQEHPSLRFQMNLLHKEECFPTTSEENRFPETVIIQPECPLSCLCLPVPPTELISVDFSSGGQRGQLLTPPGDGRSLCPKSLLSDHGKKLGAENGAYCACAGGEAEPPGERQQSQRWPPPEVGPWVPGTMRRGTVSQGQWKQACDAAMPAGRLPASGADRLDKEGCPQAPKEREGWLFRRRRRNTV